MDRSAAGKAEQDGNQSSRSESSESEEEDCPDFFSNQEFLQTSNQQASFKEGRVQIEGGSIFARRDYKHNDDLVEELLESCKAEEKSLAERISQRKSDLMAIQESRVKEGHALKALQKGLISGSKGNSKDPVPAYADYVPSDSEEQVS